jgi:hypothetical protein
MGTKKPLIVDRQTELWRDFVNAQGEVERAMEKFKAAVKALTDSGYSPKEVQKEVAKTTTKIEQNVEELRERLNHVVRVHALSKKLTFKEIWRIVYERLRESTGVNVIARAIAKGKKPYLDIVEEMGLMQKTLDIAAAL